MSMAQRFCQFGDVPGERGERVCAQCGWRTNITGRVMRQCDAYDRANYDDVMHLEATRKRRHGCGGCTGRQDALNTWVPGLGDAVKAGIDVADAALGGRLKDWVGIEEAKASVLLVQNMGFGDVVQLSVVLQHLREHYPHWEIDCETHEKTHDVLDGLCHGHYALNYRHHTVQHERRWVMHWPEPDRCYPDSPATNAERCLREVFGITPLTELCGYVCTPTPYWVAAAEAVAQQIGRPFALVHYEGNCCQANKNLSHRTVSRAMDVLIERGIRPVLIDYDNRSPLRERSDTSLIDGSTGIHGAGIAALAGHPLCRTFLGIDSGPSHLFGTVPTRGIICWLRHHPLHCYGICPNVLHIVHPKHSHYILGDRDQGLPYFLRHYNHTVVEENYRLAVPRVLAELLDQPEKFWPTGSDHG